MIQKNNWPQNDITNLFGISAPVIQGGMVWVSGAKLAAAVSNEGGLGLIGAGSMSPELLKTQIQKAKRLTNRSFGVNIPLLYSKTDEQIQVALDEGVKIFFTSAGSPKTWTPILKQKGCVVVHVASNPELALKCQNAGVDAVVLEGFEAGGHNGRDELTSFVLLQQIRGLLNIPVISAGGIGSGHAIFAAIALGAQGVQLGTIFAATQESSAHENFKTHMQQATFNSTFLRMKELVPVRLLNNNFSHLIEVAEKNCAPKEELTSLLGKGRAREGMLMGNIQDGELEIGQIVSQVNEILTCAQVFKKLNEEFHESYKGILSL